MLFPEIIGKMCGIAGYVTQGHPETARELTRVMTAALARRGPDAAGLHTWAGTAFGHRRLAILDLSDAGRQPMVADDGQTGIVFNGCIYNFLEIRKELEKQGRRFRSRCDTEVLLQGYEAWGIDDLVRRLRGMFAFAVWDNRKRTLTLVRDRLGVKPLAYWAHNGEIAFASTVSALRAASFGGDIDPQAVLEFLEFGYVIDPRAIYEGIAKLPPATILEWKDGHARQRQYWTLPSIDESSPITFEEAVEETERLLVEAVRLRLIADVPIGVLLSGGIDSALVCWALRKLNSNIKAFTISAGGDVSDESAAAAQTAGRLGIEHEIVRMPDTGFSLDEMTEAFGEPLSCSSAQAMLWVARPVKQEATVLLTGDGGDDVFLGYPFFMNAWNAQRAARSLPKAAAAAWQLTRGLIPRRGPAARARNFLDYATGGLGAYIRAHNGLPYFEQRAMLGNRLDGRQLPLRQIAASPEAGRRLLSDVFQYHRSIHFTSEFMPKVDGSTMYYGMEARAPLLDQQIWEFAAALPVEVRFHGGALKAVLREIARKRIGPEIARREKQGFTVPNERWLAERWSGMLDRLRGETLLERQGWIAPGALDEPLREALQRCWVPVQLWHLLVLEHWLEKDASARHRASGSVEMPQPAG
ncbi:MAG TPA: asparagine synthase (glutamine-hydrolyzing) [Bryobacteraceae bacterium]|nr:asparagine synthase (glutamine-hydrolyzing) [Bryobacteraceae bacterium]